MISLSLNNFVFLNRLENFYYVFIEVLFVESSMFCYISKKLVENEISSVYNR